MVYSRSMQQNVHMYRCAQFWQHSVRISNALLSTLRNLTTKQSNASFRDLGIKSAFSSIYTKGHQGGIYMKAQTKTQSMKENNRKHEQRQKKALTTTKKQKQDTSRIQGIKGRRSETGKNARECKLEAVHGSPTSSPIPNGGAHPW
jgi:hypothetical protein